MMLDTAFHRKLLSELPEARLEAASKTSAKAWSYIGRFVWGFAMVEYQVNQLFDALIDVDYLASALLTYTLNLRIKLDLIEIILKSRDIDESATFKRVHKLHDLRNVVVHWPFSQELDESGLWCDYLNKKGDTNFAKPGTSTEDNLIKYAEFDSYDADASDLYDKLDELLNTATPVTEFDDDLRIAIEKAISSSDNVVRFPSKLRTNDKDGER